VNGNTWPYLHVAQERYRFRLLNACDSRTLNLALFVLEENDELGEEVPFYIIGSDQGIVHHVIQVRTGFATIINPGESADTMEEDPQQWPETALLMGPSERMDAIVDFSQFPDGTKLKMINTGPDEPYGGFDDDEIEPADPDTTGQVMMFVVDAALNNPDGDPSTDPFDLVLLPEPDDKPVDKYMDLALKEKVSDICVETSEDDECQLEYVDCSLGEVDPGSLENDLSYGPIIVELGFDGSKGPGGARMKRWSDPLDPKDNPELDSTQIWEIWNWTPDAHPIHLHLLSFDVIGRYDAYDPTDEVITTQPWEMQKDTLIMYPYTVTLIKMTFDIGGYWMWHCHILSHEDNEMMLPFCVGEVGKQCPASLFE